MKNYITDLENKTDTEILEMISLQLEENRKEMIETNSVAFIISIKNSNKALIALRKTTRELLLLDKFNVN